MKTKIIKIFLLFSVFLAILSIFRDKNVAYAKQGEEEKSVEDGTDEVLEKLDLESLEDYYSSLSDDENAFVAGGFKELLKRLIDGNVGVSFKDFIGEIFSLILKGALGFLPSIITVVVISVMSGMLKGLNSGFLNENTSEIVDFACFSAILTVIVSEAANMLTLTINTVGRVEKLSAALFPVLLTLMTALGGASGVGFLKPLVGVFSVGLTKVVKTFVLPCFTGAVLLNAVGNISPAVKLDKMADFFKKSGSIVLKTVFSAFFAYLLIGGVIGKTVDGVMINAARFGVKSYVPIIGGYVSDGFDVVLAGCALVKNAVGMTGLLILLSVVVAPVGKLIAFDLILRFAAGVVELLGVSGISDMLMKISKCAGLLIAAIAGATFAFFAMVLTAGTSVGV